MAHQVQLAFSLKADPDLHWEVLSLRLEERFNQPYEAHLELRTDDFSVEPSTMLGAEVCLVVDRGAGERELFGMVGYVEDGAHQGEFLLATVTVMPALMALGHRRNSRVFTDRSVKEVLTQVLEDGLRPFGRSVDTAFLYAEYPERQYITQYRESDLDFAHRLMEETGITYRFEHKDGAEVLVLLDNDSAYVKLTTLGGDDGILPMVTAEGGSDEREDLRAFARSRRIRATVARGASFDWRSPGEEPLEGGGDGDGPELEDYDFQIPSAGLGVDEIERRVQLRARQVRQDAQTYVGLTTATNLTPGTKFELVDHPQGDLNGEYLVTSVQHSGADAASDEHPGNAYRNRFEAVPLGQGWCPVPTTPRPSVSGVHTATVVGGDDISTDEFGRVQVQFHWDRGKGGSCFLPVVQPVAGNDFGFVFMPRQGMQVVVSFLEGDPDQPVVIGCLYNGANKPPYLPGEKTRSTIKTQSTPGGGGFNELRFEDAAGAEEIYFHAQRNLKQEIGNDREIAIAGCDTTTVTRDQVQVVDGTQANTVRRDQVETVHGQQAVRALADRTIDVAGNLQTNVGSHEGLRVSGARTVEVTGGERRHIGGAQDETVMGGVIRNVDGPTVDIVSGDVTAMVGGNRAETCAGSYVLTVTGSVGITSAGPMTITAPAGLSIIDPATTVEAFGSLSRIERDKVSITANALAIVGAKVALTTMSIANTLMKVDVVEGAKISLIASELKNSPIQLHKVTMRIADGLFSVDSTKLKSL